MRMFTPASRVRKPPCGLVPGAGSVAGSSMSTKPPGSWPSGPGTVPLRFSPKKSPVARVLKSSGRGVGCSTMPMFSPVNVLTVLRWRVTVGPYSCTKQQKKFGLPGLLGLFWK